MEVPAQNRPKYAIVLVQRYLPVMKGLFGETDKDVQVIADNIVHSASSTVENPKVATNAATVTSKKAHQKKPQRSAKKKKGNRKKV